MRGDFVLSPNAPTTVTPGDEFEVSVGVANNLVGSGPERADSPWPSSRVAGCSVLGARTQQLAIGENHEGSARFRVKTLDRLGAADLAFTASSGASRVRRRIDLSVRPATPYMTTLSAGSFKRGSKDVPIGRESIPSTARSRAAYRSFRCRSHTDS